MNRKWKRMYFQLFLTLVMTFLASYYIGEILKDLTKIPRPCVGLLGCPEGYSFPSKHALIAFALTTAFFLETKNKILSSLFAVSSIFISALRVVTFVHTPTDVIAGAIIGIVIGFIVQRFYLFLRFYYTESK
ncbi:MAG: phosphatase PAP2 family protein [Candidatus Aenigmatarchaeota archaeon]|nr:phosphatase PAP2 family protein [Candidatus Aenigmarchaeota archaeon]